jgi:GNAT superfamily N-acetyltransferase
MFHAQHGWPVRKKNRATMTHSIVIRRLGTAEADLLDQMRCVYGAEMGGTPNADPDFCRALLAERHTMVWGAYDGPVLAGFLIGFELPEAVHGRMILMLDDVYVPAEQRGKGIARMLFEHSRDHAKAAGFAHVRWLAPNADYGPTKLYDSLAERVEWQSFIIRLDRDATA